MTTSSRLSSSSSSIENGKNFKSSSKCGEKNFCSTAADEDDDDRRRRLEAIILTIH